MCEPCLSWWHETRSRFGEQRGSRTTVVPAQPQNPQAQAPQVPFRQAVSLQVTHLALWPQMQGEMAQGEGASTVYFPYSSPRNFFLHGAEVGTFQRKAAPALVR